MKIIDESHPFYRPLWRRVALVAVLAGWTAFEVFITQQPLWMLVAGALLAYAAWILLFTWKDTSAN
ncbi:MAG TPA: hypothetical protein PLK44_07175 [Aestuariivirga sp.]|jgi:hypothetical protein|nr:DUF3329 domain-containing protein [Hyphomicrobiales bacterium]HQY73477.1 hypothetical protein [Aestuariivirga sp.]MBP9173226.1 DUF3329 domain-containing protein [Hyphomicrobiales bacterium]MBZ0260987.1 hypothetical protein [Hyphomicrobiales bacterium]MCC7481499.1 DUF3329 domain-containing protein [Hyphomicrobiales bacterium]